MWHSLVALLISLGLVGLAAGTGMKFRPGSWYRNLRKPAWTPPDIAFPIAWSLLYLLMAIAAWRVYLADDSLWRSLGLLAYGAQLLANAAWSWLFFGRRQMVLALADIVLLLLLVVVTLWLFAHASALAGWLLVPYVVWIGVALALNASVWRLNRP